MEYDIESILEKYEDDYNPGPRPMNQEPRNMYNQGQLVSNTVDGSRPGYAGDDAVSGYSEKARAANKIKFEKTLKEMLKEINGLTEKGYGNVTNIVEKYSNKLGPSKDKVQKYYNKDGSFKSFNFNQEQRKIRGAVIAEAKELNLIDMPNNMIKAVEDYKKLGKEIPRGMPQKIIKANKVPESQFYKTLNKVNAFIKQKKKFTNLDASKKFQQDQRAAALKKYSSDGFERMTRGSKTIQGGHTGDIYNEFVTTSTKAYTPSKINQETLKEVDATLKNIGLKRDVAIKAKDFTEVERLNTKGINLSAATEGYKTFKVVQPDGSNYIYGIDQKITADPMDLTKNIKVQELTSGKDKEFNLAKKRFKAKQITAEEFEMARAKAEKKLFNEGTSKELLKVQKKDAMKNAKISTGETNRISKQILSAMEKLGCGQAAGGRIMFGEGTSCAIKGKKVLEQGLKNGFKKSDVGLAQKILGSGKFLKDAVSLRGLFGPAALAFTALTEAGFVGYDMLSEGKSFKEAVGDSLFNYMLGDKTKIDSEEEFIKRLKNIPGSPSQGFRGVTDEDIGKMQYFKETLKDMGTGFKNYNDIEAINKKLKDDKEGVMKDQFSENAFQLEADKDRLQADNQDYFRTNTANRVSNYLTSDAAAEGAEAALKASLLETEDRYKGINPTSRKGVESLNQKIADNRGDLYRMNNPTEYNEFGNIFVNATPGEQSYFMGRTEFMEGGIASLNVNKKNKQNKKNPTLVKNNPSFKWWAVPPKKGPLSQGLKLPPKQVKKA